ncbi:UDP-2,4-diacetamido-2,4,6-trideoxy-beta-L-altropyranose hydrolase [Marinospirillum perlucidum]|uniref:UDP-2,4-diacetamido-2,4, 6-trideoxy-beta-L-altropyranose hydrolase n=1 Tax=Marinospirillum perlucidum TaxID=1982602 RepID=UPI000DF19124|nr:UDP-2,4-diacetamido-2,4,6-trideoxy-beta-L-altropyranose hydrolase [Marinospirillum perlucidum]
MKVYIRTDASALIGSGHVMRCLTLARALHQQGASISFICRLHLGNLIEVIQQQGFKVLPLPELKDTSEMKGYAEWLGCTEEQDASDTISLLNQHEIPADLLVVDHYGLGRTFTQKLKPFFRHRMVIDDLANRSHDCETLLDQNLLPNFLRRYQGLVNPGCKCLLGPEYALLREEFYQTQRELSPERLLVFFGGSDPWHLTLKTVKALQDLHHNSQISPSADIVIGQNNPDKPALVGAISKLPNAKLHIQTQRMAELMSKAKLMLGGGGTTHWERCILGLPGLIVTVAENQRPTTEYLAEQGACIWLGDADQITTSQLALALSRTLNNPLLLGQISHNASQVVPRSGGVHAVVQHLKTQLEKYLA